ncbi:hypothetical protein HTZ84_19080 [Haloterrigena sp. SYSU A558-1]|uniref:Major facilitator superfamily (MFS) profile domain-containing protein n=1 Tax=Haloterrigena gelatinilytica TaxID=2741724 RepID=A0ABX2LNG0_9EURY|nr:hypothetical protein [Haloterrigena gelatinilytica]NUC74371.1 hypothetical protein [Haloterrigena gelatinilytica]
MATDSGRDVGSDDDVGVALERDELYTVIRTAVRDALLDVLGTVLLLGLALLFVATGARALADPSSGGTALGVGGILVGFGIAASALGLGPSIRE